MADREEWSLARATENFVWRLWDLITAIGVLLSLFMMRREITNRERNMQECREFPNCRRGDECPYYHPLSVRELEDQRKLQRQIEDDEFFARGIRESEVRQRATSSRTLYGGSSSALSTVYPEEQCWDFPNCIRGDECPYYHPLSVRELEVQRKQQRQIENDEAFARALCESERQEITRTVQQEVSRSSYGYEAVHSTVNSEERCRDFPDCVRGDNCPYYHPLSSRELENQWLLQRQIQIENDEALARAILETEGENATGTVQRREETRSRRSELAHSPVNLAEEECRDFPNCVRGDECQYYHPLTVRELENQRQLQDQLENDAAFAYAIARSEAQSVARTVQRREEERPQSNEMAHSPVTVVEEECRDFPNCPRGDECLYYHPLSARQVEKQRELQREMEDAMASGSPDGASKRQNGDQTVQRKEKRRSRRKKVAHSSANLAEEECRDFPNCPRGDECPYYHPMSVRQLEEQRELQREMENAAAFGSATSESEWQNDARTIQERATASSSLNEAARSSVSVVEDCRDFPDCARQGNYPFNHPLSAHEPKDLRELQRHFESDVSFPSNIARSEGQNATRTDLSSVMTNLRENEAAHSSVPLVENECSDFRNRPRADNSPYHHLRCMLENQRELQRQAESDATFASDITGLTGSEEQDAP